MSFNLYDRSSGFLSVWLDCIQNYFLKLFLITINLMVIENLFSFNGTIINVEIIVILFIDYIAYKFYDTII